MYCYTEKVERRRKKRRIIIIVTSLLFVVVLIFLYLDLIVNPVIFSYSESKIIAFTNNEINNAVAEAIGNDDVYNNLMIITRNGAGDIIMMQSNSMQINLLARTIAAKSHEKLQLLEEQGVKIPLGSFSGLPILSGRGSEVFIKLLPVGTVTCSFSSVFVSKGINQTNHRIYLNVVSTVSITMPTVNRIVTQNTEVLIAECVLIGKVPETYLNFNGVDLFQ